MKESTQVANNDVKVEKVEYLGKELNFSNEVLKRIKDLTDSDVESISDLHYCSVKSVYNKRNKTYRYILIMHLLANVIKRQQNLTLQEMNILCSSHGIDFDPLKELTDTRIKAKVRFTHGITSAASADPGKVYCSFQIFYLGNKNPDIPRNLKYFNYFIDQDTVIELKINKLLDKITFKTAASDELDPIKAVEEIVY